MDHNFIIEVVLEDGNTITLGVNELDINVYQRCNGKATRVMEISGKSEYTDPGGHQLNLKSFVSSNLDEDKVKIEVNRKPTGSLSVHSFTHGEGL